MGQVEASPLRNLLFRSVEPQVGGPEGLNPEGEVFPVGGGQTWSDRLLTWEAQFQKSAKIITSSKGWEKVESLGLKSDCFSRETTRV